MFIILMFMKTKEFIKVFFKYDAHICAYFYQPV